MRHTKSYPTRSCVHDTTMATIRMTPSRSSVAIPSKAVRLVIPVVSSSSSSRVASSSSLVVAVEVLVASPSADLFVYSFETCVTVEHTVVLLGVFYAEASCPLEGIPSWHSCIFQILLLLSVVAIGSK